MAAEPSPAPCIEGFVITRDHVDLTRGEVRREGVACRDVDDVLGGIARAFKLLPDLAVADPYAPEATLILNLGVLSGTAFMTGLRAFFHGYSPLKRSKAGAPAPMWTAGSGKFGTKLRHCGVEEVLFTGRAPRPTLLRIAAGGSFELLDASDLLGKTVNGKIQALHERWPDAHFAVIGPAGEHYEAVRYAAIGLSTVNQLRSGDPKARFCGRGGFGGVMGSKNLLAIVADAPDPKGPPPDPLLKKINLEVARGEGSRRFRDRTRDNGGGGTWANYEALGPVHALPEMNFVPTGTDASAKLYRPAVEADGRWLVKDEACYRCGIRCHKNVYDRGEGGKAGKFRAKLDYEPLNLLSGNLGVFDVEAACDLVEQVDELGMDSISLGVTLAYVMEYNRRHPEAPIADGLSYGDAAAAAGVIDRIGRGALPQLGQGTKALSEELGETGYAMHSKGVEYPAYLPQTNPGYPFALAGGHMSMRTYLLLLFERETGMDYWVDAITERGPTMMRDDILGACKFAGLKDDRMCEAVRAIAGLELKPAELQAAIRRAYLRGYAMERAQGFLPEDYTMPAEVHRSYPQIDLPHFNTESFFLELRDRVLARFDTEAGQ